LRTAAFDLFSAGDYRGVLPIAREAAASYPAKGEVPFWLACVHCRLGDPEAALAALRAGLARGRYWPPDWLLDDDLEPLRTRPELAAILRESAEAQGSQPVSGSLEPDVLAPSGVAGGDAAPAALVLALHGWGQDADELALHWQAAAGRGFAGWCRARASDPRRASSCGTIGRRRAACRRARRAARLTSAAPFLRPRSRLRRR
jgi:hypothetical protein